MNYSLLVMKFLSNFIVLQNTLHDETPTLFLYNQRFLFGIIYKLI